MLQLLKQTPERKFVFDEKFRPQDEDAFSRIRCPLCEWQPTKSSRWVCDGAHSPEPHFGGCGTVWNTFATRGCCPGCRHQWRWTSCLHCQEWSRHDDWYDEHY